MGVELSPPGQFWEGKGKKSAGIGKRMAKLGLKMGTEWGSAHQSEGKGWKWPKMDQNPPNLTQKWALNGAMPIKVRKRGGKGQKWTKIPQI